MEKPNTKKSSTEFCGTDIAIEKSGVYMLDGRIYFPQLKEQQLAKLDQISYIQCDGNYCKLYFMHNEKSLFVRVRLGEIAELIKDFSFIHIHRSYMVNLNAIDQINPEFLSIGEKQIPVSRKRFQKLKQELNII